MTETVAAGATVRAGGTHEQLYYRPTVLADVTPEMPAFREEIFGPVAPVVIVKDVDEAVRSRTPPSTGLSRPSRPARWNAAWKSPSG